MDYILLLIWIHFVFDFLLQTDWMATNKSHNRTALGAHCAVYTTGFLFVDPMCAVLNGLLHFIVDSITSKVTTRLHQDGRRRAFFNVIGFDQAIHLTILILTFNYLRS